MIRRKSSKNRVWRTGKSWKTKKLTKDELAAKREARMLPIDLGDIPTSSLALQVSYDVDGIQKKTDVNPYVFSKSHKDRKG